VCSCGGPWNRNYNRGGGRNISEYKKHKYVEIVEIKMDECETFDQVVGTAEGEHDRYADMKYDNTVENDASKNEVCK
jgi:hypothetical protein